MKPAAILMILMLAVSASAVAQTKATVSTKYVAGAEALAADDYAKAKTAFTDLAKESQGATKTKAQAAADAKDLASMRKAFRDLSEDMAKMEMPAGYGVAFCPMYAGGSRWVQKQGNIANPYFGKAMSTCGSFQKK
jgi:hypothetical protein